MKKLLLVVSLLSPLFGFSQTYNLLIGGYTRTNESKGISLYHFDTQTGKAELQGITETENPDFFVLSSDRKFLYTCNVDSKGGPSSVSAFKYDYKTGKLEFVNKQLSGGSNPVHIEIDKGNKNVFISHYTSGNVTVLPVKADGSLAEVSQNIQYTGTGPHKNQTSPHVHASLISSDNKYLLVADLGTDKVNIYNYNPASATPLTPANPAFDAAAPGDGPRHMEFSPDKKFLYVIQELTAFVRVYKYADGKLTFVQTINMSPADFTKNGAADIHITPDGAFLYASNRGAADNIVLYARNQVTGKLTTIESYPVGKAPRGFVIDPTGNYLLAAGQEANIVNIFKINKATGKLTDTGNSITVGQATCLKFVAMK